VDPPSVTIDLSGLCLCCGNNCNDCCCQCGPEPGIACLTFFGVVVKLADGTTINVGNVSMTIFLSLAFSPGPNGVPRSTLLGFSISNATGDLPDQQLYPVFGGVDCGNVGNGYFPGTFLGLTAVNGPTGIIAADAGTPLNNVPSQPAVGGTIDCAAGTASAVGQLPTEPGVTGIGYSSATITQGACGAGGVVDCDRLNPDPFGGSRNLSWRVRCTACRADVCYCLCGLRGTLTPINATTWQDANPQIGDPGIGPYAGFPPNCPPGRVGLAVFTCAAGSVNMTITVQYDDPAENFSLTFGSLVGVVSNVFGADTLYILMNVVGGPCDGQQVLVIVG
jgi:hypothetical protein